MTDDDFKFKIEFARQKPSRPDVLAEAAFRLSHQRAVLIEELIRVCIRPAPEGVSREDWEKQAAQYLYLEIENPTLHPPTEDD